MGVNRGSRDIRLLHSGDKQTGPPYQWSLTLGAEDYVAGLKAIEPRMSDLQRQLLINQYQAPNRTVFATQLARMANVAGGHPVVNSQYGRLGHMFAHATGHQPDRRRNGDSRWWSVWSRGYPTRKGFIWELLPAVAEALERLGWVTPQAESGQQALPASSPTSGTTEWGSRTGTTVLRLEGSVARSALGAVEVDRIHNQLQNALFRRLSERFGIGAVVMEEGFADIKVRLPDGSIDLFEVKADGCPRSAIRAALGQLLEYSYAATCRGQRIKSIVVAAPGALGEVDAAYVAYLHRILCMDLRYLQIHDEVAVDSYQCDIPSAV